MLSITRIRMQQPRRQLKKNGAVIVRKFLTGAETAELQSVVHAIYEAMAEVGTFARCRYGKPLPAVERSSGLNICLAYLRPAIAISLPDTDG